MKCFKYIDLKKIIIALSSSFLIFNSGISAFVSSAEEETVKAETTEEAETTETSEETKKSEEQVAEVNMHAVENTESFETRTQQFVFWAESYEKALSVAEQKNGELVDYDRNVAVLRLETSTSIETQQSVEASQSIETSQSTDTSTSIDENGQSQPDMLMQSSGALIQDETVLYPDYLYEVQAVTSDGIPDISGSSQWHLPLLHMDEVFSLSTGKGVNVAIVDSGIDLENQSLSSGIVYAGSTIPDNAYGGSGYSILYKGPQDFTGHGTHVAGLIRADGSDPQVVGMAPGCSIISIKALERNGNTATGYTSWIVRALLEAVDRGADIVNLSLGGSKNKDGFLTEAIEIAASKGVTVICAAGNYNGTGYPGSVDYPASDPLTICVTALKLDGIDILFDGSYSKYGDMNTVSAPGTGMISLEIGNGTRTMSGTSMACAVVTGEAALLKSFAPDIGPSEIKDYIVNTSLDLGDEGFDVYYGAGMIRPLEALKKLAADRKKDTSNKDKKSKGNPVSEDENVSSETDEQNSSEPSTANEQKSAETLCSNEQKTNDVIKNDAPALQKGSSEEIEEKKKALLNKIDNMKPEDETKYSTSSENDSKSSVISDTDLNRSNDPIAQTNAVNKTESVNAYKSANEQILFYIIGPVLICVFIIIWLWRRHINEK